MYPDGAAARDKRLKPGDQILEVNGESFRNITHSRALAVLRQTPAKVRMMVYRDETSLKDDDMLDIIEVELLKKPGRGLGLSIVGRRNGPGVYISDVVKGGAAEADGRLMQGDQILTVNGNDLRTASQVLKFYLFNCETNWIWIWFWFFIFFFSGTSGSYSENGHGQDWFEGGSSESRSR